MSDPSEDRRLLAALAGGRVDALAHLYDAYGPPVYRLLLARGLAEADAEDALQDVFLSLVDRGRGVASIERLPAYLFGVARNIAARRLRRRQTNSTNPGMPASPRTRHNMTEGLALREAVRELPPEQAEVVVLKVWQEMTFAEISAVLDISPNTAASRYRYALAKLRAVLGETNDER